MKSQFYAFCDIREINLRGIFLSLFGGSEKPPCPEAPDLAEFHPYVVIWEKANQWDLGFDFGFFNNRLNATVDLYIRDTKDMITDGVALPAIYGADSPKMNAADLRTSVVEVVASD